MPGISLKNVLFASAVTISLSFSSNVQAADQMVDSIHFLIPGGAAAAGMALREARAKR